MSETISSAAPMCPLCSAAMQSCYGGMSWSLKDGGRQFAYVSCEACSLMLADPQPTGEELDYIYHQHYDYAWFQKRKKLKQFQGKDRAAYVTEVFTKLGVGAGRSVLDIGCGHGFFVDGMIGRGWQTEGLDLLEAEQTKAAAERGVKLHVGSVFNHQLGGRQFDAITMWHTLEHFTAPREALKCVVPLLKPGGLFLIAVPNYESLGYARRGPWWVWCQKAFIHPWHYSPGALKKVLPPELEPVWMTTRDTWDAQFVETTKVYRAIKLAIYYLTRGPRKIALKLGLKDAAEDCDEVQFYLEEGLRLLTYAGYRVLKPALQGSYEDALKASELLLVVKRR